MNPFTTNDTNYSSLMANKCDIRAHHYLTSIQSAPVFNFKISVGYLIGSDLDPRLKQLQQVEINQKNKGCRVYRLKLCLFLNVFPLTASILKATKFWQKFSQTVFRFFRPWETRGRLRHRGKKGWNTRRR